MVRLGFINDPHISSDTDREQGANDQMPGAISHLLGTKNAQDLIFGGDQIAVNAGSNASVYDVPHTDQADIDYFWDLVESTGYDKDRFYSIPGNHEAPVQQWVERTQERGYHAAVPYEINYDGVTVLLVDTVSQGGAGTTFASSWTRGWVSTAQRVWIEKKLQEAHSRGDIALVFGHHPMALAPAGSGAESAASNSQFDQYNASVHSYWVVQNLDAMTKNTLGDNSPAVVFCGHDAQYTFEGSKEINGVTYVWKDHYHDTGDGSVHSVAYIDADPSTGNVTVTTVEPDLMTENVIVDTTPSW